MRFIADNFKNEGFEVEKGQHKVWKRKKNSSKKDLVGEKRGGTLKRSWQKGASTTTAQAVVCLMPKFITKVDQQESLRASKCDNGK